MSLLAVKTVIPAIRLLSLLAVMLFTGAVPLAHADELYTKTIELRGVSELEVSDGFRVVISQGEQEFVRATGRPQALANIDASVSGNRLLLSAKSYQGEMPVLLEIQLSEFERIALLAVDEAKLGDLQTEKLRLSIQGAGRIHFGHIQSDLLKLSFDGSGEITGDGLSSEEMQLRLSGSGNVAVDYLEAQQFDLNIAGSAGVHLTSQGKIDTSNVHLSGTGVFSAANAVTRAAEIDIAGSASVWVHVIEYLNVSTSGSGTVTYTGNPNIDTGIFGSGIVRRALQM